MQWTLRVQTGPLTMPVIWRMLSGTGWLWTPISTAFSAGAGSPGTFHRCPWQQGSANKIYLCEIQRVEEVEAVLSSSLAADVQAACWPPKDPVRGASSGRSSVGRRSGGCKELVLDNQGRESPRRNLLELISYTPQGWCFPVSRDWWYWRYEGGTPHLSFFACITSVEGVAAARDSGLSHAFHTYGTCYLHVSI